MDTNDIRSHSTVIRTETKFRKTRVTPFLKKMSDLLKDNRVSMDALAKTPLTKDDLLANVIVTPL